MAFTHRLNYTYFDSYVRTNNDELCTIEIAKLPYKSRSRRKKLLSLHNNNHFKRQMQLLICCQRKKTVKNKKKNRKVFFCRSEAETNDDLIISWWVFRWRRQRRLAILRSSNALIQFESHIRMFTFITFQLQQKIHRTFPYYSEIRIQCNIA